jgi:putative spermidine/putrescine transport system permease protein
VNDLRRASGPLRLPILAAGALLASFLALPMLIVVPTSWTGGQLLEFPPKGFSLQWYDRLTQDDTWTTPFWTSVQTSLASSLIALVFGSLAALGMRRLQRARTGRLFRSVFIAPLAIPYIAYALGVYELFGEIPALGDTLVPFVLAQSLIAFPLVYVVVAGGLARVDPALGRAASTMGARWPMIAWRIDLPLVRGSLFAGWLFAFTICFDEATLALFLAPIDRTTLPQELYGAASESISPELSAVSVVVTIIAVLVLTLGTVLTRRLSAPRGVR